MAEDLLTVKVDARELLAALARVPTSIDRRLHTVARTTANSIAREAKTRLQRALSPAATGRTVSGIVVEEMPNHRGYQVVAERRPLPNLPLWLEAGTEHMQPRRFLAPAVALEQGPHRRAVERAVQEAIDELGLG